jgi:hypothetical protein
VFGRFFLAATAAAERCGVYVCFTVLQVLLHPSQAMMLLQAVQRLSRGPHYQEGQQQAAPLSVTGQQALRTLHSWQEQQMAVRCTSVSGTLSLAGAEGIGWALLGLQRGAAP